MYIFKLNIKSFGFYIENNIMLSHENDILHQCHFCLWFRANGYIDFLRRCEKLEIYFQLERGKATQC